MCICVRRSLSLVFSALLGFDVTSQSFTIREFLNNLWSNTTAGGEGTPVRRCLFNSKLSVQQGDSPESYTKEEPENQTNKGTLPERT